MSENQHQVMKPNIFRTDESMEFYTQERCFILEVFNQPDYTPFSIARARVEPGVTTALHALKGVDEAYYVLEGEGEMEIDGNIVGKVQRGYVLTIPMGASQRIRNIGEGDLVFLCVCASRFEAGKYVDLEG